MSNVIWTQLSYVKLAIHMYLNTRMYWNSHVTGFGKDTSYGNMSSKERKFNHINSKKLECVNQVT